MTTTASHHSPILDLNDNKLQPSPSRSDSPIHIEVEDELDHLIDSIFGDQYPLLSPYLNDVNDDELQPSPSR